MSHGYPECCRVVDVDNIQEIHEKLSMNVHIAVSESEGFCVLATTIELTRSSSERERGT